MSSSALRSSSMYSDGMSATPDSKWIGGMTFVSLTVSERLACDFPALRTGRPLRSRRPPDRAPTALTGSSLDRCRSTPSSERRLSDGLCHGGRGRSPVRRSSGKRTLFPHGVHLLSPVRAPAASAGRPVARRPLARSSARTDRPAPSTPFRICCLDRVEALLDELRVLDFREVGKSQERGRLAQLAEQQIDPAAATGDGSR